MEWKPIETAPKDGTPVLVYGDNVEIGSFMQGQGDDPDTWCDSGQTPTHWMPLPVPPVS